MVEARKRRREDPAVRRAQILDAAARSFRAHGLQATTVDMIASAAGVSVGLLYRYFASKAAIIAAIVARDADAQFARIVTVLDEGALDIARWPQLIAEQLTSLRIDRESFALLLEISAEVCRSDELRALLRDKRAELVEALAAACTARGADPGSARYLLDMIELASAVSSGLAMHAVMYADSLDLSDDRFRATIAAMLAAAGPGQPTSVDIATKPPR